MADAHRMTRHGALGGRVLGAARVSVSALAPAERISLRAPAGSLGELSSALGIDLPTLPKTSASRGSRSALWLGPDEWLVIEAGEGDPLGDCGKVGSLHSAVDISHRNVGIAVVGSCAAQTINAGCPQDLSLAAFPPGACSRTVLGKVEIILWRHSEESFRIECWRSFSEYVFALLCQGAPDASV